MLHQLKSVAAKGDTPEPPPLDVHVSPCGCPACFNIAIRRGLMPHDPVTFLPVGE